MPFFTIKLFYSRECALKEIGMRNLIGNWKIGKLGPDSELLWMVLFHCQSRITYLLFPIWLYSIVVKAHGS